MKAEIKELIRAYKVTIEKLKDMKDTPSEKDKFDPIDKSIIITNMLIYKKVVGDLENILYNGDQD